MSLHIAKPAKDVISHNQTTKNVLGIKSKKGKPCIYPTTSAPNIEDSKS